MEDIKMAGKKKRTEENGEDGEFTDEEYEQSEQEMDLERDLDGFRKNTSLGEKPLYVIDPSRVTAEQAIDEGYAEVKKGLRDHRDIAEMMGNEDRVNELTDTLGQVDEHKTAAKTEVAAAYSVFPIKALLGGLKAQIERAYVADIAVPEEIKSRVITYDAESKLLGMSIEATCMVASNKDGSVRRNADGKVHTIDGWVDQAELQNARFYMNAEVNAAPNKELFNEINTKLAQDEVYRTEIAQAFAKAPNQVFEPQIKQDLSEYLMPE